MKRKRMKKWLKILAGLSLVFLFLCLCLTGLFMTADSGAGFPALLLAAAEGLGVICGVFGIGVLGLYLISGAIVD